MKLISSANILQILLSSVFAIVVYFLTSQPFEWHRMCMFVGISVLTSLASHSLGLLIGAGLSVESAFFLGPVACISMMLFPGFFVKLDDFPEYLKWLNWVSFNRYGFEGNILFDLLL